MIYDIVKNLIKSHFYIISYEKYKSEISGAYLERFVAKHVLLKPKLIVHNDQPFGYKRSSSGLLGLEKFPIFIDIEYFVDSENPNIKYIENIDLYSETEIKNLSYLGKMVELSKRFSKYVTFQQIKEFNDKKNHLFIINSEINDFIWDCLEDDPEEEGFENPDIQAKINLYLFYFANFIKELDQVLVKPRLRSKIFRLLKQ